ncbi:type II toxin-antitoxin system VapC family toxin [Arcticibacter tournemirensis]|uniref:Type II toxin-antitoxin system VapC family toxin n=1 Tax=Arcticibacter tournemirensis TaxID=699437 RepID=A0A5M9HC03_9SPHI|nr:PIN domain-containing protein [Arcticibacter tournemirensis]KAA8484443.1 type II toxin-antitoxin system VapC family toxin [Arcticibacter tournemirensis]
MSQYLLDAHALLWMKDDSDQLSERVREILRDDRSDLYVSIVSFWEIVSTL